MPKNHLLVALKISHPKIQQLITEISSSLISRRVFSPRIAWLGNMTKLKSIRVPQTF